MHLHEPYETTTPNNISTPTSINKAYKWIITLFILTCVGSLIYGSASLLPVMKSALLSLEPTIPIAGLFFFLCAAVTNPFSIGYGIIVLSCGAVFGWPAFIIVYLGSIVGATFWFSVFRVCTARFDCQINRVISCCCKCFNHAESTELTLRTIDLALSTHPIRSAALVQLTFLPFGSVVGLLASTQLDLLSFVAACCISRLKLINYIWLARSAVGALTRDDKDKDFHITDFVSLIVSLSFSIISLSVIGYYAKHKLSELHMEDAHQQILSDSDSSELLNHDDECRIDMEPRLRKVSGNRGPLSPNSCATLSSQADMKQTDSHSSALNDEYASLLRPAPSHMRHSISNPLNVHVCAEADIQASNEQVLAAISSAISPARKNRVSIGSYQSANSSPRQRLHSNASPTSAYNPHR